MWFTQLIFDSVADYKKGGIIGDVSMGPRHTFLSYVYYLLSKYFAVKIFVGFLIFNGGGAGGKLPKDPYIP